jgi:hypothetical protein
VSNYSSEPLYYEIKVQGVIDNSRLQWFNGLEIRQEGGTTTLIGLVEDAAALYGIISRARDLGLTLLSLSSRRP